MSDDIIKRLRESIAAGPTPGYWDADFASAMRNGSPAVVEYFVRRDGDDISIAADIVDPSSGLPSAVNANYIAAASPDNIAALLDRLAEADEMRNVLLGNGFVKCDISACNCGSWHHRYGLPERMRELRDKYQAVRAENEKLRGDAARYRWLRGREDGRYMTVYAFRTDVDEVCLGEELDATIDAAMAAEKGKE